MPFLTLTRGTHHSLHPLTLDGRNDKTSYIYIHSKADVSQLNLPLRTKNITQKKKEEKLKQKQICSEQTVQSRVHGVSPGGGKRLWWERLVKQIGFKPAAKQ